MKFQPGQLWKYRTRKGEEASLVSVIETEKDVVHIHISGVNAKTPDGNILHEFYMPISHKALENSVTELISELEPGHQKLHKKWLESHDTRGQGFFTVELAKFLDGLDK